MCLEPLNDVFAGSSRVAQARQINREFARRGSLFDIDPAVPYEKHDGFDAVAGRGYVDGLPSVFVFLVD